MKRLTLFLIGFALPLFSVTLEDLESFIQSNPSGYLESKGVQQKFEKLLNEYAPGFPRCEGKPLVEKLKSASKTYADLPQLLLKRKSEVVTKFTDEGLTLTRINTPWLLANLWGNTEGCGPRVCNAQDKFLLEPWTPAVSGVTGYVVERMGGVHGQVRTSPQSF